MPVLDVEAIRQRLPHRYPFLLLDRVLELDERHVVALKNVSINEEFFSGHFPQRAIMPAVLILEGMAQAAGLIQQLKQPSAMAYLVGVDDARIRRMVVPGDQLRFEGTVLRARQMLLKAQLKATVDGEMVAQATILLATESG